jgi:hypothetical protein
MQIFFCEKCSKRLSDADIANGSAIAVKDLVYCRACAKASGIVVASRTEIVEKSKTEKRTARHAQPTDNQPQPGMTHPYLVPAVIGGIAFVLLAVLMLLSFSKPSPQAVNPPVPPAREKPAAERAPLNNPAVLTETPIPKESPKPPSADAPKSPAVEAPKPAVVEAPKPVTGDMVEETILLSDLEKDGLGWQVGTRVEDSSRPGSRWVVETPKDARRVIFTSWELRPRRDSIFTGPENAYISFDYYITAGPEPAFLTYTVWETSTSMNWYTNDVPAARGKWGTHRINVAKEFIPVAGRPVPLAKDASIKEIKIGVKCAAQDCTLRIDNLRIFRMATAGSQSKPAPTATVTPAAGSREVAVFESDFEQDANGWTKGERESDNVPEGSKWAYRALTDSGGESTSREVRVQAGDFKPERQNLFFTGENMSVSFDYFIDHSDEPEGLVVMVRNFSKRDNPRRYMNVPVQGKWSHLVITLKDLNKEGTTPVPGDSVTEFFVQVMSHQKDVMLIIDNVRFAKEAPSK